MRHPSNTAARPANALCRTFTAFVYSANNSVIKTMASEVNTDRLLSLVSEDSNNCVLVCLAP